MSWLLFMPQDRAASGSRRCGAHDALAGLAEPQPEGVAVAAAPAASKDDRNEAERTSEASSEAQARGHLRGESQ